MRVGRNVLWLKMKRGIYLGNVGDHAGEVLQAGEGENVNPGEGLDAAADELRHDAHNAEQVHLHAQDVHLQIRPLL